MTDFSSKDGNSQEITIATAADKRKEEYFKRSNRAHLNQKNNKLSNEAESDSLISKQQSFMDAFRPPINSFDPSTFAFYGSAQQYYVDAIYNIINYYPFDGTQEEHYDWYMTSPSLDTALFNQKWPGAVGSVRFNYKQYIEFNGGAGKIPQIEFLGQLSNDEPGVLLSPSKGNTVEFWMKKDGFNASKQQEVVFDIGTLPGSTQPENQAKFKLHLSASAGSPFRVTYTTATTGSTDIQIGDPADPVQPITTASVGDGKWHHYAVSAIKINNNLKFKLYVDGQINQTVTQSGIGEMPEVKSYICGKIGKDNTATSSPGSFSGSLDDFKYWKGLRNNREIGRYFDKKVFANDFSNKEYTSRMGLYYNFNKPPIGKTKKDSLVFDYSGNEITGRIREYDENTLIPESAINQSQATKNTEVQTPILENSDQTVQKLISKTRKIGEAYDRLNNNNLERFIPEWARQDFVEQDSESKREFQILLQMMAVQFDEVRNKLDATLRSRGPNWDGVIQAGTNTTGSYDENYLDYGDKYFVGCVDEYIQTGLSNQNTGRLPLEQAEDEGIDTDMTSMILQEEEPLLDQMEQISGHLRYTKPTQVSARTIHQNIKNYRRAIFNKKGTEAGYAAIYKLAGVSTDVISDVYSLVGGEIPFKDNKTEKKAERVQIINFRDNSSANLHQFYTSAGDSSFIPTSTVPNEYTFEGSFIFAKRVEAQHEISTSSVFGIKQVSGVQNNFVTPSPDNANFTVIVEKQNLVDPKARFVLKSSKFLSQDLKTPFLKKVYDDSRWNVSLRIRKKTSSPLIDHGTEKYEIIFSGYNYIDDKLMDSFSLTSELSRANYNLFNSANKTIFIGANKTNITGSVIDKTDIRILNFSAWKDQLTDEELQLRSKTFTHRGRQKLRPKQINTDQTIKSENTKLFRINFSKVSNNNTANFTIEDETSGQDITSPIYDSDLSTNYDFKSHGFDNKLTDIVYVDYINQIKNTPLASIKGLDQVQLKENPVDKFDFSLTPETNILSFEKSMYEVISKDMISFFSGVELLNNAIGEPVNRYRANYKLLQYLKEKYFENVQNEISFEKFVNYYKWIGASFGNLVEHTLAASTIYNTGMHNVVESHALERNKYHHKYAIIDTKPPKLETNMLSINELLYDWEHGHHDQQENKNCLWQKDRKEVPTSTGRKEIKDTLTTKISNSYPGNNFRKYALRNLVRPYKHTITKQKILNIGHNKDTNKVEDLYKIIYQNNTNITISSDDIYEFKQCDDITRPIQKERYTSKTNVSGIQDYNNADADFVLPFSLYSSSVGTDFSKFKTQLKITNNHFMGDSLKINKPDFLDVRPPHRKNKIGQTLERIEAYKISETTSSLTIETSDRYSTMFHSPIESSRLYSMANIKASTDPIKQGNYHKDYEIVQTAGRTNNNNYLVEQEGKNLTGSLNKSEYIIGTVNHFVPDRTRREHVFVNRFSPPGGPETSGKYGLDREAEEFSVYSTINYRNTLVRGVLNNLSSEYSERFGYRSGSTTQASIHKTNRNYRRFMSGPLSPSMTGDIYYKPDNLFVQHEIPQTDIGYLWITASALLPLNFTRLNGNSGHQHTYEHAAGIKSESSITFLASSELGAGTFGGATQIYGAEDASFTAGTFTPVDFVNLNTIVLEPLSINTNTLGTDQIFTGTKQDFVNNLINPDTMHRGNPENSIRTASGFFGDASTLNSIILNRQGPYGWPSWKQIRGSQHAISRAHKKNNIFSAVFTSKVPFTSHRQGYQFDYSRTEEDNRTFAKPRSITNFKEVMATSKYKPLSLSIHTYESGQLFGFLGDNQARNLNQRQLESMWNFDQFFHEIVLEAYRASSRENIQLMPSFTLSLPLQNNITGFANQEMSDLIRFEEEPFLDHENLKILNNTIGRLDLIRGQYNKTELNYLETIYPREINTYTKNARTREKFKFFGWDSKLANRSLALTGNLNYSDYLVSQSAYDQKLFLQPTQIINHKEFQKDYFGTYEMVDLMSHKMTYNPFASENSRSMIKTSKWVLDSRSDFSTKPISITSSFFNDGTQFSNNRDQATRNEGILQNDYSIFPLGNNFLRGAPPFAPIYNRRIPQIFGSDEFLAGESLWEATSSNKIGPFYDSYDKYAEEIRLVGQNYSIIPEFTISKYIEDIYASSDLDNPTITDDFLHLTGAIYHSSSGDISIGTQFFKTYSTSDFMKYFQPFQENLDNQNVDLFAGKLTLKCSAAKRFLPYRGMYPAERAVQVSEIFHRNYLKSGSYNASYISNTQITEGTALALLDLKIENTKSKVSKPLLAPGVLFNSIKSGLAVDYPLFSSTDGAFENYLVNSKVYIPIGNFDGASLGSSVCYTGSLINNTVDSGIPRLKGETSRRVNFDDLLYPERLYNQIVPDNEPHPSASIFYGTREYLKVNEYPPTFGTLNRQKTITNNAINFSSTYQGFVNSMLPYKSAIGNFASETVKFFLEDEKLQTAISQPVSPLLNNGVVYKMRVYITNNDVVMYDRHSAFGPPVDESTPEIATYTPETTTVPGTPASGSLDMSVPSSLSGNDPDWRNALNNNTVTLQSTNSQTKTYKFVLDTAAVAATATIEIATAVSKASDLNGATFTLKDAQSSPTEKTYIFVHDTFSTSGQTDSSGRVKIQVFGMSTGMHSVIAQAETVIESTNGHNNTINVSNDGSRKLTLTQATAGTAGNNAIATNFSAGLSIAGFSNGTSGTTFGTGNTDSSGNILVALGSYSSGNTPDQIGTSLATAIGHANGHQNLITANYSTSTDIITLTQVESGDAGNTTISGTGGQFGTTDSTNRKTGFAGGASVLPSKVDFLTETKAATSGSHGFLPYVPPYLDPNTDPYAEISFTPSETRRYTIPEIINGMSVTYTNMQSPNNASTNTNFKESMVVSASLNLTRYVSLAADNYNFQGSPGKTTSSQQDGPANYRWVIHPRWETPVMDFSNNKVSALNLTTNQVDQVSGSPWKTRNQTNYYQEFNSSSTPYLTASRGMWHQYGEKLPTNEGKGYYLTILGARDDGKTSVGDLASAVGFVRDTYNYAYSVPQEANPSRKYKLGRLASKKRVCEAVVAIPYYLEDECELRFFDMDPSSLAESRNYNSFKKQQFLDALRLSSNDQETELVEESYESFYENPGILAQENIAYQLRMMDKYVFPPQFDFIKNDDVDPFVSYIFQFKAEIGQEDLSHLWQNLYPESGKSISVAQHSRVLQSEIDTDVEYISSIVLPDVDNLFKGKGSIYKNPELFLEKEVRWLVFKVKYRAESDYVNVIKDSISKNREDILDLSGAQELGGKTVQSTIRRDREIFSKYSYNWPYDFFSIIEMIKIDSKVDYFSRDIQEAPEPIAPQFELSLLDDIQNKIKLSPKALDNIQTGQSEVDATKFLALDNMIFRHQMKASGAAAPSGNAITVNPGTGFRIKSGTESIYLNGVLQTSGTGNDYTISGNTVTFVDSIGTSDAISVTYIKEKES